MSILYVDELRPIDPNSTVKIDLTNNAVAFTGLSSTQNFSDFTSTNGTITTGNITNGTITNLNSTVVNIGTTTQQTGFSLTVDGNIYCNDISTADLIMSNDRPNRQGNEIDGTKGSWVFQEGDENMYLINRKTGKRYKLTLEEV